MEAVTERPVLGGRPHRPAPGETGSVDLCLSSLLFHPVYAGPAVRFKRYEPGLRARGIQMRVFSAAWSEPGEGADRGPGRASAGRPGELAPPESIDGIPVRRVFVPRTRGPARMYFHYGRGLVRHCVDTRPQVLQLLNLGRLAAVTLWRLRRAGVPTVFTHTMAGEMERSGLLAPVKRLLAVLPFQLLRVVVVSSGVMRDELRRAGVRTRIEVIPNGVDIERFHPPGDPPARAELRRRLGFRPEEELIVFVGGFLNERKGVDVLAEAWRELAPRRPRARLVLVGPHHDALAEEGPEVEFQRSVRRTLEASGAAERVEMPGAVDAVEDYLRVADVFVFPSRREGMPNVVAEAFACGAPSILTPFEGLPEEFGRPGREYELVERRPEALAAALQALLEEPERRAALGRRAREWVERELDVERSLDLYAELYRELSGARAT